MRGVDRGGAHGAAARFGLRLPSGSDPAAAGQAPFLRSPGPLPTASSSFLSELWAGKAPAFIGGKAVPWAALCPRRLLAVTHVGRCWLTPGRGSVRTDGRTTRSCQRARDGRLSPPPGQRDPRLCGAAADTPPLPESEIRSLTFLPAGETPGDQRFKNGAQTCRRPRLPGELRGPAPPPAGFPALSPRAAARPPLASVPRWTSTHGKKGCVSAWRRGGKRRGQAGEVARRRPNTRVAFGLGPLGFPATVQRKVTKRPSWGPGGGAAG